MYTIYIKHIKRFSFIFIMSKGLQEEQQKNIEIEISLKEPVLHSAQEYYKKYKETKKKLEGLKIAIAQTERKLQNLSAKKIVAKEVFEKKKLCWFEKFHWCFSKNNLLILAGKDSQSNEDLVKQHLEKNDLLFHSTIQGSSHVILKGGNKADKEDLEDAALFASVYSKGWSMGYSSVDVYFVYPEQVSKTPQTGEYLEKGSFVIRGEKNFFKKVQMVLSLGVADLKKFYKDGDGKRVFVGRESSLQKHKLQIVATVIPGKEKKGDIAKQICNKMQALEKTITLDEVLQALPPGTMEIKREKKR